MKGLLGLAFAGLLAIQISPSVILAWQQTQRLNDGRRVRAYEIGRLQRIGVGTTPTGCDLEARESCRLDAARDVYVRLSVDAEGVHRAEEARFTLPAEDGLFIKGRLASGTLVRQGAPFSIQTRMNGQPAEPTVCDRPACLTGVVTYGIERWYGAQGVPGKLDRTARKDVLVDVRVGSDGAAVIDGITVAGKTFAGTARLW
jgi:hypothetical protein